MSNIEDQSDLADEDPLVVEWVAEIAPEASATPETAAAETRPAEAKA